jgi:hypothetical protein
MKKFQNCSKLLMWFMALVLVAFVAGCGRGADPILGGGGGRGAGAIPGAPPGAIIPGAVCTTAAGPTIPTVTSSDPTNGNQSVTTSTSGVAPSKLITANFSLAMNPATINSPLLTFTLKDISTGNNVPGTVAMNAANTIATFTTSAALSAGTSYTAVITQAAMSATGTPIACIYAWNFKTVTPAATGPAGINLGLATPFAIASAGGITNSGATKINGDVVLDPDQTCNADAVGSGNDFGACGGNPLNVPTHNAGDKVITQIFPDTTTADAVMADLNATWISIAPAALPGATVLGCGTIGTAGGGGVGIGCALNSTLPPGVYISATSSTIDVTGNLTLDAAGNADAVWVFQAPSALTVNVGSTIILSGGAKASNVWWFVGSDASVNGGSTFQGNILASASISLGTLATSCGRMLSGAAGTAAGTLTLLSNTVSVPGHPNAPPVCQ